MPKINVNERYELLQIIKDFGDPLEIFREAYQNSCDANATKVYCHVHEKQKISETELIIDIWDNGDGLSRDNIQNFFDLANSTKVDKDLMPKPGMIGYKGHGAKIFFNAKEVVIISKTNSETFWVSLKEPLKQIEDTGAINYSDVEPLEKLDFDLPSGWNKGFFLRIRAHRHFRTQHTKFKLRHTNLRDYAKWFTVFGSVRPFFESGEPRDITLFLKGLDIDTFFDENNNIEHIDPLPIKETDNKLEFEKIGFGHYLPPERYTEASMKQYADSIQSAKPYYQYYSKTIYKSRLTCSDGSPFNLIIHAEGYETKRRYDPLLTRRGRSRSEISHTDTERYGIWACKGGIPVEKIDNWVEGGRGTFSYLQAFVDCDLFQLTANRGSINNSDIELIDLIKNAISEVFSSTPIKRALQERVEFEKFEQQLSSIEEDGERLKERFNKAANNAKKITFEHKGKDYTFKEPRKLTTGYSESETMILLVQIITLFPKLFPFSLLDYDTANGIDFVVEYQQAPKYIELKGSLNKKINHPFRHIYKFICYDIEISADTIVEDIEDIKATLTINKNDDFQTFDTDFKNKKYKSYRLDPANSHFTNMEIIGLKQLMIDLFDAKIG